MAPAKAKSNNARARETRPSQSRHTTPGSVTSVAAAVADGATAYIETSVTHLLVPGNMSYEEILKRHNIESLIPDPDDLTALAAELRTLVELAGSRTTTCEGALREIVKRKKLAMEAEREAERLRQENEAREHSRLKRAAASDSDHANKAKKLKETPQLKEEPEDDNEDSRPLAHGAHALAPQDGSEYVPPRSRSASSSSLSDPGGDATSPPPITSARVSRPPSPAESDESDTKYQPKPALGRPQTQIFGDNPLMYDDPTIYHIREVTEFMTDEEKKDIYRVAAFPYTDLHDRIAGIPPDADFTGPKPTNQVRADTFLTHIEPYLRGVTDEDMAFLRDRGDRSTPLIMPRRGPRHYREIWADEGEDVSQVSGATLRDRRNPNLPRGSVDQLTDATAETDQVSAGPLLSRLLATLKGVARPDNKTNGSTDDAETSGSTQTNGHHLDGEGSINGDVPGGLDNFIPATSFPEAHVLSSWKQPTLKQDFKEVDSRIKDELRAIGFLAPDDEPDYDAFYDDEIAQRLRILQSEFKKQSIINGAKKALLHDLAQEYLAYQEWTTIKDDLDSQVTQAFLKRSRTMTKTKKNVKKPGAAGAGSGLANSSVARNLMGENVKALINRRERWTNCFRGIFEDDFGKIRSDADSVFTEEALAPYLAAEKEKWDEDVELAM